MNTLVKLGMAGLLLWGQSGAIQAQIIAKGRPFLEMADPTADTLSDWSTVNAGLNSSFVSIDKRYARSLAPQVSMRKKMFVKGWKGERVSAQLLLWSKTGVKNVSLEIGDFRSSKRYEIKSNVAQARFVRYVMTDEYGPGCGYRKPKDFAASLSPDMLDDLDSYDIKGKEVRPVWVTVDIPRNSESGIYSTTVTVKSGEKKIETLTLELEVVNELLPEVSQWTFHLDQWQHPSAVARVEGLTMWSDAHFSALKPVMKRLADAGQKVITTTLNKDPWNVQTLDPYADMIIWKKKTDGSWQYDYTVFDRWVTLMMDLGVKKMINCYSIIPWNNMIHYKDEATGKFVDVEAKPGTAVFEEMWAPFLTDFSTHLKAKGWLSITNIAMDEREADQMEAAFALLKKIAPELGVSYADNQKTYKKFPDSKDISIASGHPFSKEDLINRRAMGLNSTFYVYCGNSFPNQFTFSDPAESTYLAWYALAAGFDGVLHWAYNSWVETPLQDSRFRTWPAGDTYVVYPQNRSSIRFERMLEGIQDYEKVRVLRKKWTDAKEQDKLTKLDALIQKLDNPKRTETWNEDLNQAKALLN
ncbi:DUF4091 domain-containing protein [Sphingobacterium tabacisoli]|uniref:DUF4091 domain-containing protein n=1 Tax=Sphingobacterium tabacisoli TaxID=2044855 RepID=UPI001FE60311|nr:glycoside hydrolase domain-containing protein [Sphingobacterium tabacisoli]